MGFIQIAKFLIDILPLVYQGVHTAEQTFGAGNGATKLGAVLQTIEAAHNAAPQIKATFDELRDPATQLINGIVALKNQNQSPTGGGASD